MPFMPVSPCCRSNLNAGLELDLQLLACRSVIGSHVAAKGMGTEEQWVVAYILRPLMDFMMRMCAASLMRPCASSLCWYGCVQRHECIR